MVNEGEKEIRTKNISKKVDLFREKKTKKENVIEVNIVFRFFFYHFDLGI